MSSTLLTSVAAKLPSDAVESAMLRLDEAIEVAGRYKAEGKVISAEDFEKRDVRRRILKPEITKSKNPIKPVGSFDLANDKSETAKNIVKESWLQVKTNFVGDIYWAIARPDWFTDKG